MTKVVTPAMISYTPYKQGLQLIKFHSVVSEDHTASAQITKFPVQTGFQISNSAIRQNRGISITGIISNHLIAGSSTAFEYSTNNSKTVFEALESLVQSAIPCEVLTNLGIYNPVIFTKFTTKQSAGMIDSMTFTITGEEVMVATQVVGTVPKVLSFKILTGAEADARAGVLRKSGSVLCDCNELSEAKMELGESFILESKNEFGQDVKTTYINKGKDPTTGDFAYEVHTSDTDVYSLAERAKIEAETSGITTDSGFSAVGACLVQEAGGVLEEAATDLIDTAMGELKKSIYGAVYDTMHMTENEYGQHLILGGIGCMVRGITKVVEDTPYWPGEALPTTPDILEGAKKFGNKLFGNEEEEPKLETITQIQCCETG